MESWRIVWRNGFAKTLSVEAMTALRDGLANDDQTLIQGNTMSPPPLMCVQDWPVEEADALGYAGWKGHGLKTVGEVSQFFADACYESDRLLREPAACRWFLNWFDDTPRDEMRRELLPEVELAIRSRVAAVEGVPT